MEENKETTIEQGLICEDVITRERVALEILKIYHQKTLTTQRTIFNRLGSALGLCKPRVKQLTMYNTPSLQSAFDLADAFMKEAERRKQHE